VGCEESPVQRECSIRPVYPSEGERLREIAIAAKSYWGYDVERVVRWATMGDFSPQGLREKEVYVAEAQGQVIGWASLMSRGDVCWLDDLWIEPEWIGRKVGSLLFGHAVERAKQRGATQMEWEAEPHALGFYERMGGRYLRDSEPSIWGRVIPVMGIELT
jgi:GNAT superfamily N-acetyltransferase